MNIIFSREKFFGAYLVDFYIDPDLCIEINGKLHY